VRTLFIAIVLCAIRLTAWADPAASAQVTVTGQGVGVSQMNGGTIQTGLSREEVAAITKATVEELVRKLTPRILGRSFAQQGWVYRQSTSIGVVEAFLANVKGRKIPQDQWPQAFAELTWQCLHLPSSERDAATASTEVSEAENTRMDRGSPVLPDVQGKEIIPAEDMMTALAELSMRIGWSVFFDTRDMAHVRSSALHGSLEPRAAIAAILVGTGLDYSFVGHDIIRVFPKRWKSGSATNEGTPVDQVPTSSYKPNAVFGPDELQLAGNIVKRGVSLLQDALGDPPQFPGAFCEEGVGDSIQATRTNSTRGCLLFDTRDDTFTLPSG
jgi:hypothetical protein